MDDRDDNGGIEEIPTITKLLDPQYPLLVRFREAAPGSYKHSVALASMVEGVSISLGLDVELMKLCAVWHDLGKIFNPKYFAENQIEDEDPHRELDPKISYELITRHVSDGVMLLINEPSFPRKAIETISRHHGNTVLRYFFNKSGKSVEDLYRYKTERPKNINDAVLMICDQIEAVSRSRIQAGTFDLTDVIDTTINYLIEDSQLDEVYLKLGDLKRLKTALAKELEGSVQRRPDYDEVRKNGVDLKCNK